MSTQDKESILDELIKPFGFRYITKQDIFTTRLDAWQREFGYTALYDNSAVHFHMIFDNLPVYFNYQNKTWLLEVWKGQYGIATGFEIGLYYADHILSPEELPSAFFQSVSDTDMIKMSFTLFKDGVPISKLRQIHWWLTAFHLGRFSQPSHLSAAITLTFPNAEMAKAFADALIATNHPLQNAFYQCSTVGFTFSHSSHPISRFRKFRISLAQLSNRFWCKTYLFITRPFTISLDKTLYLYYQLPFAFRRMFRIRRYKRNKSSQKH